MYVRAVSRALSANKDNWENAIFCNFQHSNERARSFRARTCSARQSIFLIKEILFDYLIASVAQKLIVLAQNEVKAKLFKNDGGGCDQ